MRAVLIGLAAWVLGVALQLQQAGLWSAKTYLLGIGLALFSAGLALVFRRSPAVALTLALVAGCLAGVGLTGWRATLYAAQALDPVLEGVDIEVTGRVASMPQRGAEGTRFEFAVDTAQRQGRSLALPSRLLLASYVHGAKAHGAGSPRWRAGDRWRLTVRLRRPHGAANPHGFDRERWLWENGLGATGYVRHGPRDPAPVFLGRSGWHPIEAARQQVAERIADQVGDARSAGVLAALVVGDQSAIERDDWATFRATGVAHLMSISGLHVTLFAWLATGLLGRVWRRVGQAWPSALLAFPAPFVAGLGGVCLATAYALFAGWGVPAQRTVLMLSLVVFLKLSGRQWPWAAIWTVVMAAVLLLDPWALLQPGFWLSFVAVAILFASGSRQDAARSEGAAPRWRRWALSVGGMAREQTVMTVALAPLSLLLFGQVSLVGLVANLLAIPWVTLVVTPLALAGALLPPLWALAALAVQGLGAWLGWLAHWPAASFFWPIAPITLGFLGVLGGVLLVLRLPWAARAAGLVMLWPLAAWSPPRPAPGGFELLAMDVGQGSAVLVRTATHSLLYDTGPRYGMDADAGERVVVPVLRALGERPDAVVVSHRDSDHAGGAQAVQIAWPQARWLSSFDPDPARRCVAGQRWEWDGVAFEILHPAADLVEADGRGRLASNAMSCVLRVSNVAQSAWLSGDLDAERETRLALAQPDLRATVLLAPHHGSHSSSSPVLLNTLRPDWVLIQSGYRNRFDHPAPEVLDRYRTRGIRWVNTPDCGAATWSSAAPNAVHCWRQERRHYWHHPGALADDALAPVPAPSGSVEHLETSSR